MKVQRLNDGRTRIVLDEEDLQLALTEFLVEHIRGLSPHHVLSIIRSTHGAIAVTSKNFSPTGGAHSLYE